MTADQVLPEYTDDAVALALRRGEKTEARQKMEAAAATSAKKHGRAAAAARKKATTRAEPGRGS